MDEKPTQIERRVDQALEQCRDQHTINDEVRADLIDVVRSGTALRVRQDVQPFRDDDILLMAGCAVLADSVHATQTRHSGQKYITHPRRAVRVAIEDEGRTRPTVLGAIYAHDVIEMARRDKVHLKRGEFQSMLHRVFVSRKREVLRRDIQRVTTLVDAATKDSRDSRSLTSAATLRKLLASMVMPSGGIDGLDVKGADRGDNQEDILTHRNLDRRNAISEETYAVFARIMHVLSRERMAGRLVDDCAKVLNTTLASDFGALRESKIDAHTDVINELREILTPEDNGSGPDCLRNILELKIEPSRLAEFALQSDRALEKLTLPDFRINSIAPLYTVVVVIRRSADPDEIIDHIRRNFVKAGENMKVIRGDPDELPYKGVEVEIDSKQYGKCNIRIIDSVSYARAPRGIIPVSTDNLQGLEELPARVRAAIHRILNRTKGDDVARTSVVAREELLTPPMIVFARDGRKVPLPVGATGLDLAARVNLELVAGVQEVRELSGDQYVSHPLLAPLKHMHRYEFVSCLSNENFQPGRVKARLSWMHNCRLPETVAALRRYFGSSLFHGGLQDILKRGREYLEELSALFGITPEEILAAIKSFDKKHYGPRDDRELLTSIGQADIDPLHILSQTLFKDKKEWRIRVELPNKPDILHNFLGKFGEEKINVDGIIHIQQRPPSPHILRMTVSDPNGTKSPFDIMKVLLSVSDDTEITLVPKRWTERTMQRVGDLWKMIAWYIRKPVELRL